MRSLFLATIVVLVVGIIVPGSLRALLVDGAQPVSCTEGLFHFQYVQADLSLLKAQKIIEITQQDLRFLKVNATKKDFTRLLMAKKLKASTDFSAALSVKTPEVLLLKTPLASDSVVFELLIDTQKKMSIIVYSADETCPVWVSKFLAGVFLLAQPSMLARVAFAAFVAGGIGFLEKFSSFMRSHRAHLSTYACDGRMNNFSTLLATSLSNLMHLRDAEVFCHTFKFGKTTGFKVGSIYDASWPAVDVDSFVIPSEAKLVVLDVPCSMVLTRLMNKGILG